MNPGNILQNPLGEVFGFPTTNLSDKAGRYRQKKLCPFNNKVPNCTKDKANNPLGVCSIIHNAKPVITCPVRFREDWKIIENAALFFFSEDINWTSLTEIKLSDANNQSAGNIDFILVSYDNRGKLLDFGSLEVQAVYISGNIRNPFDSYMSKPDPNFKWPSGYNYPRPDYLSSSRKRLLPQMLYKGGILKRWSKKQALALQKTFFDTLPPLPVVNKETADIAWFLYDLEFSEKNKCYNLTPVDTVYTEFEPALSKIITPEPANINEFVSFLQDKLDEKFEGNPPDAPSLKDIMSI